MKFLDKNGGSNSILDDQNSINKVDTPSKNKSLTSTFMGLNLNKKFKTLNSMNSVSRKDSVDDQSQGFCVQSSKLFRIIIRRK